MNRFYAYALIALAFSVAMAPNAFMAHADTEGQQLAGTPMCDPKLGMDGVKFFVGTRHIATICIARAELERAHYIAGPETGMVQCKTLVVKSK